MQTTTSSVAVHTISFRGPSGIILCLLVVATVFYILGYSTNGWYIQGNQQEGLWEGCACYNLPDAGVFKYSSDHNTYGLSCGVACIRTGILPAMWPIIGWLQATQAMITIGLIGLCVALILIFIYQCLHSVNKNSVIIALVIVCFISIVFMFIGFIIYGAEKKTPNWSFAMAVIGACFTLAAGVVTIIQMVKSGVTLCF